ncbi:MAG: Coenzyme F420 hydrogenase/dehydrogenase, beta subunit C-terminal domain [Promethearchaeota archaeon]
MIEKISDYDFNMISPKKLMYATYKASNNFQYNSLFKAKEEILKSGKYNEKEINDILDSIFDAETARKYILEELKGRKALTLEEIVKIFDFPTKSVIRDVFYLKVLGYIEEIPDNKLKQKEKFKQENYKYRVKEFAENFKTNSLEPVSIIYDNNVCCQCGVCSSICPVNGIELTRDYLYIDEGKCKNCGLCYSVCPQTFSIENLHKFIKKSDPNLEYSEGLGFYQNIYSARTLNYSIKKVGQDGGIVTSLLYYLLSERLVDAIVTIKHSKDYWKPKAEIIEKVEDLYKTAGTTYVHTPILSILDKTKRFDKIAIVALPCKIKALAKGELFPVRLPFFKHIKYKLGLFCMESFQYEKMFKLIHEKLNIDIDEIIKMDINRGRLAITLDSKEEFSLPLDECNFYCSDFCKYCNDLTAELADISLGSIGSEGGWSTVITRTKKGERIFKGAIKHGLIEPQSFIEKIPLKSKIERIAEKKREHSKPIELTVI